jgi:hypothetical protein
MHSIMAKDKRLIRLSSKIARVVDGCVCGFFNYFQSFEAFSILKRSLCLQHVVIARAVRKQSTLK